MNQLLYCIRIFTIVLVFIATPVLAQNAETDFMQQQSGLLQHDADSALAQAEKLRSQAEQYRAMAESADRNAVTASNVRDKEDWEKTARQHREKVEKLEREAAAADEKAQGVSANINDLQSQIEEKNTSEAARQAEYDKKSAEIAAREAARQEAEDNNPNTGFKVGNIIGLWRMAGDDGDPFVIVQKDPESKAYPHKLEAHTPHRVWSGDFHTDPPPGEPLITFSYKPKAEEMNPEIPEWTRKKIEGELEWTLEVNADGTCGTPALSVDFYPGEVKWEEKEDGSEGKVSVEGRGDSRQIDLHRSVPDMRFYSYGASKLYLRPQGMPRTQKTDAEAAEADDFNEYVDTVDALVHGQRFFIDAVLPHEEAEKQGEKLTVKINASGGDSTSIELQSGSLRKGRSSVYTHYDAITIADPLDVIEEDRDPPLLSVNYILGYQGARIDLDVENAELVTFSYGDALQTVPVFNSWVQRGINQHQEAIQRLRPFFSMVFSDPSSTKDQKEEATDRLTMITNYERIMESDKIHDFIRNKVGNAYFNEWTGMVGMSDADVLREAELTGSYYPLSDKTRDGSLDPSGIFKGVVWTSQYEMHRIQNTITSARVNYRDTALKELPVAMTFALYSTVMGMSGVGDVYTLSTGRDIFDKPVPGWQRIMAAVSIASSNVLSFTAPHMMSPPSLQAFNPSQLSGRAMRSGARARLKTQEHIAAKYSAQKLEGAMKKMNAEQVNSVSPGGGKPEDVTPSETPLPCAERKNPGSVVALPPSHTSAPPPRPQPLDADILDLKRMYGPNAEFVDPGSQPLLPPQKFETCNCAHVQRAMQEDTGIAMSEMTQFGVLARKGEVVPGGNMPLSKGYTDAQLVAFLHETGAEVMLIPARGGRALTLEAMEVWKKSNWRVRDVIKTADTGTPHAIELRRFNRNEKGEIVEVVWYDPAFGKEARAPVCDYLNKMVFDGYDTIMYRWKGGSDASGMPQTAVAKPTIEYLAQRNPGSSAAPDESNKPPTEPEYQTRYKDETTEDIDPDSIQQIGEDGKVITEADRTRLKREVARLDSRLEELHPGNTKPRLNTVSRKSIRQIYEDETWLPPSDGGAAFSLANREVTGRYEVAAVRIRPGHEKFISWVLAREGTGLVPEFWESGTVGVGKRHNTVPMQHLEWIDGDQKGWVPFTEKRLQVDEFSMED